MQSEWIVLLIIAVVVMIWLERRRRALSREAEQAPAETPVEHVAYRVPPQGSAQQSILRNPPTALQQALIPTTSSEEVVVIDIETTGLDPDRHQITQVAARRCWNLGVLASGEVVCESEVFTSYCKLRPRSRISVDVQQLTGITTDLLRREGRPLAQVIREFHAFVGDKVVIAHNASFDMKFLNVAAAEAGVVFANNIICTLAMARTVWPHLPKYRLVDLASYAGVDATGAHNAVRDVEITFWVYFALMKAAGCVTRIPVDPPRA